ncbi:hypothetical protein AB1Y20_012155 [Prymnesium parvum]|uniref:C2 domain-containing protein n=1 Tax=Prymnesium parvum TaxID=97485 RepID=A0AB34INA5_PRYPA
MVLRLFVKVERFRRLHESTLLDILCERGEDGTFGLGLTDDNEIVHFYHQTNSGMLRVGDQVREVSLPEDAPPPRAAAGEPPRAGALAAGERAPVVRERLAAVISRQLGEAARVRLHVARASGEARGALDGADVFTCMRLLRRDGSSSVEYSSDLWVAREDAVWGAFWTVSLPADATAVWFGLYRSNFFTEPLIGYCEFPVASEEGADLRWHALYPEKSGGASQALGKEPTIVGEVLLTVKKYSDNISVSPMEAGLDSDDSMDDPVSNLPPLHAAKPITPIEESTCAADVSR